MRRTDQLRQFRSDVLRVDAMLLGPRLSRGQVRDPDGVQDARRHRLQRDEPVLHGPDVLRRHVHADVRLDRRDVLDDE